MQINKIKITKEKLWTECTRCKKKIYGVSERQVKHNFNIHKMFCKSMKIHPVSKLEYEDYKEDESIEAWAKRVVAFNSAIINLNSK